MFHLITWLAIAGAVVTHTGAAICFKLAAQSKGRRILLLFASGNLIGLGHMICKTIAVKGNDPKLVLAVMVAFMGVFFVVVINRVFREELGVYQWFGIVVIMIGTMWLVNIGPREEQSTNGLSPSVPVSLDASVVR